MYVRVIIGSQSKQGSDENNICIDGPNLQMDHILTFHLINIANCALANLCIPLLPRFFLSVKLCLWANNRAEPELIAYPAHGAYLSGSCISFLISLIALTGSFNVPHNQSLIWFLFVSICIASADRLRYETWGSGNDTYDMLWRKQGNEQISSDYGLPFSDNWLSSQYQCLFIVTQIKTLITSYQSCKL